MTFEHMLRNCKQKSEKKTYKKCSHQRVMSTVSTSVIVETQKERGENTEKIIPKDFCCLGFVVYFVCFSNLMKASNVQILIN